MKSLLIVLLVVIFSGCSTTTPAVSAYRLAPNMSHDGVSEQNCKSKSLKVEQLFSSTALRTTKMHYALSDYEEFSFHQSEWAESPSAAMSELLVQSITKSALFSSVSSYKSRSKTDYVLEGNLEEFQQYFSKDKSHSFVKVSLSFALLDKKSSKILKTTRFRVEKESSSLDAKGGVKALNLALESLLSDANRWLGEACK